MRLFKDTQESINNLFVETGECASLYKRYAQKKLTQKATTLLSEVLLTVVLILLGSVVLLLLFFSLAFLLGDLLGSTSLGFGCLTLVALLLFLVVYLCRKYWIVAPVTRLVANALEETGDDIPAAELEQKLQTSKDNMMGHLHELADDTSGYNSKALRASRLVYHVLSLYNGFKIGISAASVVNNLLHKARKKRK